MLYFFCFKFLTKFSMIFNNIFESSITHFSMFFRDFETNFRHFYPLLSNVYKILPWSSTNFFKFWVNFHQSSYRFFIIFEKFSANYTTLHQNFYFINDDFQHLVEFGNRFFVHQILTQLSMIFNSMMFFYNIVQFTQILALFCDLWWFFVFFIHFYWIST